MNRFYILGIIALLLLSVVAASSLVSTNPNVNAPGTKSVLYSNSDNSNKINQKVTSPQVKTKVRTKEKKLKVITRKIRNYRELKKEIREEVKEKGLRYVMENDSNTFKKLLQMHIRARIKVLERLENYVKDKNIDLAKDINAKISQYRECLKDLNDVNSVDDLNKNYMRLRIMQKYQYTEIKTEFVKSKITNILDKLTHVINKITPPSDLEDKYNELKDKLTDLKASVDTKDVKEILPEIREFYKEFRVFYKEYYQNKMKTE